MKSSAVEIYLIDHNNPPSRQGFNLVSLATYIVCVNFILEFKFDYERQILVELNKKR